MQGRAVAVRTRIQIDAGLFDYYFDSFKDPAPAQVMQDIPALIVAVVETRLLAAVCGHYL